MVDLFVALVSTRIVVWFWYRIVTHNSVSTDSDDCTNEIVLHYCHDVHCVYSMIHLLLFLLRAQTNAQKHDDRYVTVLGRVYVCQPSVFCLSLLIPSTCFSGGWMGKTIGGVIERIDFAGRWDNRRGSSSTIATCARRIWGICLQTAEKWEH